MTIDIQYKPKRMVGVLYRRFYKSTSPQSLSCLGKTHTAYSSQVWNPYLQKNIDQLEHVYIEVCCTYVCKTVGLTCRIYWSAESFNVPSPGGCRNYL